MRRNIEKLNIQKERTLSDAELLRGGADYVEDKEGNMYLNPTEDQVKNMHLEMEDDLEWKKLSHEQKKEEEEHFKDYTVGVFSASSESNEAAKQNTRAIAEMLAEMGMDGMNGGYSSGAMRTFAEGYAEKSKELGFKEAQIKRHLHGIIFSKEVAGGFIKEKAGVNVDGEIKEMHTLSERAGGIIDNSDATIATEGGLGTMAEVLVASIGENLAQLKKEQLEKDIEVAEKRGASDNEIQELKSQAVPVKPIIILDSTEMFKDIMKVIESKAPGASKKGLPEHIYVFERHDNPNKASDELEVATLQNDEHMKTQVRYILEMYHLMYLGDDITELQEERLQKLGQILEEGEYRVVKLSEIIQRDLNQ